MSTLLNSLEWGGSIETTIRAHIGVASGEDAALSALFKAACRAGSDYIGRDFVDADGEDEDLETEYPDMIIGVAEWMRVVRSLTGATAATPGVIKVKTAQLEEQYGSADATDPRKAAMTAAKTYWFPFVLDVWRV